MDYGCLLLGCLFDLTFSWFAFDGFAHIFCWLFVSYSFDINLPLVTCTRVVWFIVDLRWVCWVNWVLWGVCCMVFGLILWICCYYDWTTYDSFAITLIAFVFTFICAWLCCFVWWLLFAVILCYKFCVFGVFCWYCAWWVYVYVCCFLGRCIYWLIVVCAAASIGLCLLCGVQRDLGCLDCDCFALCVCDGCLALLFLVDSVVFCFDFILGWLVLVMAIICCNSIISCSCLWYFDIYY